MLGTETIKVNEHHEVLIVGGGTCGLYTANKLVEAGIRDVIVLESRGGVGGRVSTTRDENGNPMFNNFAWRIRETNTMMLALAKELDIKLVKQTTPPPADPVKGHANCKHGVLSSMNCQEKEKREVAKNRPPLSDFAEACLDSASEADKQDRESGYAGRTGQIAWPDESHGIESWFVEGGMDRIPKTLADKLPESSARTNHRASEVERMDDGKYLVSIVKRDENSYTPLTFTCNQIVLATPPYSLRGLKVAKDMAPALFAVHERRLGHIYAKCKPGTENVSDTSTGEDRIYRKLSDSVLQQLISGDYGGKIFQAGYACDRFERVWRELQFQGPEMVMKEVKTQLNRINDIEVPPEGWDAIEEIFIRIGFVHRWQIETHVTGKNKEELSLQAITPHPSRLPGLYLAGEAFSPFQGWTEGALWTGEKVANLIVKSRKAPGTFDHPNNDLLGKHAKIMTLVKDSDGKMTDDKVPNLMVYKGLVVDVDDWVKRHPGGEGMIKGHRGEDLSELFDNFHNGWPNPLATLFGLQVGCTDTA